MSYLKNLLIASLFLMTQFSFSQVSNFSLEVNFPVTVGDNFFGEYYDGIVDIGAKYRVVNFSPINIGISVNGGYFKKEAEKRFIQEYPGDQPEYYEESDMTNFTILPRIFAELDIESLPKLRPFLGAGYSFLLFNAASHGSSPSASTTENGLNINAGVYYLLTKSLFAQLQYDYIALLDSDIPTASKTKSVSIIKFGIGIML